MATLADSPETNNQKTTGGVQGTTCLAACYTSLTPLKRAAVCKTQFLEGSTPED